MSYTYFCLHNASFHLDLQITHIAIHILQIVLLVRFLSTKQAFSFAQMVKIYIFYATRPHAMPLTSRLFFWCAEHDYTPSKILKSIITIAHSTPRAQIGHNLENQAY